MTERPETVVVCEKHEGKSEMNRLKKQELASWLAKYRLGQLWTRGQIGGTRWYLEPCCRLCRGRSSPLLHAAHLV